MSADVEIVLDDSGLAQASGIKTIFNFDPETGLFTGSSQEFLAQGVGIPAHSTVEAPPPEVAGKVSVYRDGGWQSVPDHRGIIVYITSSGEAVTVSEPGDYPPGTTLLKPATDFDKWGGTAWVTDTAAAQKAAISEAETEKAARIAEAGSITLAWQTQLMLGIITDADKESLTRWMIYLQAVQAVDTSKASKINWPPRPEK
ncbi:TPA: tail fiber assembly protein [Klebsiella pneumoniae]|nr:tail fiber assembly protein [Klebsiella pneumoniae]